MPRVFTRRYMTVELYSRHQQQNVFYTALKCFSSEGIQKRCLFSPKAKPSHFFGSHQRFMQNTTRVSVSTKTSKLLRTSILFKSVLQESMVIVDRREKAHGTVPWRAVPDFIGVIPATLEMLMTDDPPFSLDPFTAAAALSRGCSNCKNTAVTRRGGEGTTALTRGYPLRALMSSGLILCALVF